ncbi:MAG: ABC transporter ATP-binding protein [Anaerolineae bacterium]|nr:ABC transporter ATP-binding protein [Anaerolineae bacterium]
MHHTIEVEHLSYDYPDGRRALHDVSLQIGMGEKVALVGPNGAGKSTLLLHLNSIFTSADGTVRACGLEMRKENLGKVRAGVGMVFQNPDDQLFSPTVFDDVAFGLLYQGLPEAEVRARVAQALATVEIADYGNRVPYHLSAGEKKRVALATVLAMDPEILVLDEPTSGLDPSGRCSFINLLDSLPQTMLVATHDLRMVRELFARTVVLDDGRVVADGATADILTDAPLLTAHGLEE